MNSDLNRLSFLRSFHCSQSSQITNLFFGEELASLEILNARKCTALVRIEGKLNLEPSSQIRPQKYSTHI